MQLPRNAGILRTQKATEPCEAMGCVVGKIRGGRAATQHKSRFTCAN